MKPVDYKQYDSRWAYNDYSTKGEKTNIYVSGCGPTSAADIIAALSDSNVTPATTAKWALGHGYKVCGAGTANSYFVPMLAEYGIKATYLSSYCYHNLSHPSHAKVKQALKDGKWLIANPGPGNWTTGGHFIVVYQIDSNNNVYICDPASNKASRLKNTFDTLAYQTKYYWIVDVPKNSKDVSANKKQYLSYGDVNDDVGTAQIIFKALGYYTGEIDKSFGPKMLDATKKFQRAYNLTVDGFYGPNTKATAEAAYNKKIVSDNSFAYKVGSVYKLIYDRNVRTGPGIDYSQKKRTQLTADGQKHCYTSQTYAALKAGTQVTVNEVKKIGASEIWLRIPSGWIAGVYNGCKCVG